jgi:hypothetical protein
MKNQNNMKKHLALTIFVVLLCTQLFAMPTVSTEPATDITGTTAKLNGTAIQNANPISSKGFEWKLNTDTEWTTVTVTGTDISFSTTISGLTPETTYDFRVFARIALSQGSATRRGETVSFETTAEDVAIVEGYDHSFLQMFPNPVTNGQLTIDVSTGSTSGGKLKVENVEIFDMNGKRVYFHPAPRTPYPAPFTINISHLPNGMYIVKIGTSTGSVTGSVKIVKQ